MRKSRMMDHFGRQYLGALAAIGGVLVAGCARPMAPTGGPVPETPLRVVESSVEPLSTVASFDGAVEIRFERSLSERMANGSLEEAVVVSPLTSELRIDRGGESVEVSLEEGFREGIVYRITLLPRFQDRYQNRMAAPFDLIFSTGPELAPNLLAGMVTSRLTLDPLPGVRVDALAEGGEFPYSTVADSTGIFTFPHLPEGRYNLVAYDDQNRNRRPDFSERQDSFAQAQNRGDTVIVMELSLLAPDTTAATLEDVARQDSLTLRITFDDYLDPEAGLEGVTARLFREGANAPEIVEILHPHIWRARAAEADDAPAGPVRPTEEIILLLSRPLLTGVTYRLVVEGVPNIAGVPGGGGEIEVEGPTAPANPPAAGGAPPPLGAGGGGAAPSAGDPPPLAPPPLAP